MNGLNFVDITLVVFTSSSIITSAFAFFKKNVKVMKVRDLRKTRLCCDSFFDRKYTRYGIQKDNLFIDDSLGSYLHILRMYHVVMFGIAFFIQCDYKSRVTYPI